jgi:hypothetical protein
MGPLSFDWRKSFLTHLGPGLLGGIRLGDWLRLLRDERFAISPTRLPKALAITFQSLENSFLARREMRRYREEIEKVPVEPPLFVLGHWRNGTTHLHYLLGMDSRFAFPNIYQTFYPHSFLTTEARRSRLVGFFLPKRRPMDSVAWNIGSPQEDEFALCVLSRKSPCLGWVFPRHRDRYDRYLTFRHAGEGEEEEWRAAFDLLIRKLTLKHRRPLVLKSPPHTGRIRLLLRMFPGSKFVHIHRDPYAVFQSSRNLFQVNLRWNGLQRFSSSGLEEWVLRQHREMYEAFFEERKLIPEGRYCEVKFEELELDPVGQLRAIYQKLGLPDFQVVQPELERYVATLAGYRKNSYPDLGTDLKKRIAREWQASFEEWGYAV